ncbi:fimbria/pilus outer membrane usher protein [Izhakiella australiensis]|nr:fimbria/pilus outer membrane usher protein [Izhakiella australiensis]
MIQKVYSKDYFDPALLSLSGGQQDIANLDAFSESGGMSAGKYLVDVYINQNYEGQHMMTFSPGGDKKNRVELTTAFLKRMGVNINATPKLMSLSVNKPVGDISQYIKDAQVKFNISQLRLDISIPQVNMQSRAQGYVDSQFWDEGVPAALLNYNINGSSSEYRGTRAADSKQNNLFANLSGGVNWGAWRLRSNVTYSYNDIYGSAIGNARFQKLQVNTTYLQRDIIPLKSQILLGENNTGNEVFDSFPFQGLQLASSDEMLPDSLRGFAPLISGVARTNARVTVTQNGNIVYQSYVPPGPFRISDLYQAGQGGNLIVTIREADGEVRTQKIAYSSLPVMRRPGSYKYEITTGRFHSNGLKDAENANFLLASYILGLPHNVTFYSGGLFSERYLSAVGGVGLSLGSFGALSADITTASAKLHGMKGFQQGESYRLRYSKSLMNTGTSIDLTAYRYSTQNYYSFTDFNNYRQFAYHDYLSGSSERQRSLFQTSLNQQLGKFGTLFLSASRYNYWNNNRIDNTLSAGLSTVIRGISVGVNYSIERVYNQGDWPENRQLAFNMQVPLALFSPQRTALHNIYASYQLTHSGRGQTQQQAGITGNALNSKLSYNLSQSWATARGDKNSNLNVSYQGAQGQVNVGYNYNNSARTLNAGINGGIVIHPHGVTLSQMLGDSLAIVEAPGAGGATVTNGNITTNDRGYAVIPYLAAYRRNNISLDPTTLPDDVDIKQSSVMVYPTRGAVVRAIFNPRVGYQALITMKNNNRPLRFGSTVTVISENNDADTSIVGEAGQVYLTGLATRGKLFAKWGAGTGEQCRAAFDLSHSKAASDYNPVRNITVDCQ